MVIKSPHLEAGADRRVAAASAMNMVRTEGECNSSLPKERTYTERFLSSLIALISIFRLPIVAVFLHSSVQGNVAEEEGEPLKCL